MTSYGKEIVCDQINTKLCVMDQAFGGKVASDLVEAGEVTYDLSNKSARFSKITVLAATTPAAVRKVTFKYAPTTPSTDYWESELVVLYPQTLNQTDFYVVSVRTPATATPQEWPIEISHLDGTTTVAEAITLYIWAFAKSRT